MSMRNYKILFISLIIMTGACTSKLDKSSSDQPENKVEQIQYCYENVFPYKDSSGLADRENLKLIISGKKVVGEYNWLPAEKDSRTGTLHGEIDQDKITAVYEFMQEGLTVSTEITIVLLDGKAEVKNEQPELGLNTILKQIECK